MKQWHYAARTLLLDDEPSSDGIHLTPEQRLSLLEEVWQEFSNAIRQMQKEIVDANS